MKYFIPSQRTSKSWSRSCR